MNFEAVVGQAAQFSPDIYIVAKRLSDNCEALDLLYANPAFHSAVNCNVKNKYACCRCTIHIGQTDLYNQALLSIKDGTNIRKTFRVSVTNLPQDLCSEENCLLLIGRPAGVSLSEERERLYSTIAKQFIELSAKEATHLAMRSVGLYFDVDACYAARVNLNSKTMDFRYVWRNDKGADTPQTPKQQPMCDWMLSQLAQNRVVKLDKLEDLTPEILEECHTLRSSETKACIMVPVLITGNSLWFIGIHNFHHTRQWSSEDIETFKVVGDLLGNAFSQKETARSLKETQQDFHDIGANIPGLVYQVRQTSEGKTTFTYVSQGITELTGWNPADILNNPAIFDQMIVEEDRKTLKSALHGAGQKQGDWACDIRLHHRQSNKTKWVRANGRSHIGLNGDIVWNGLLIDISHHRKAEDALRTSEERLRRILGTSPIAIGISDVKTFKLIFANQRLTHMFDIERQSVIGFDTRKFYSESRNHRKHWVETRRGKNLDNVETRCQRTDGSLFWAQITTRLIEYGGNEAILWWAFDITDHKQTKEALAHLAHHDALTGLANRRLFDEHLHNAIALAARTNRPGVLFYFDLDGFKPINDQYGHGFGDWVLDQVALRLRHILRESDIGARLGGDEFAVIAHGIEDINAIDAVINKMQKAISAPYVKDGITASIGLSIGVVRFFGHEKNIHQLVMCADNAMYQAKQAGKGTYRLLNMAQSETQAMGS